jgi:hypothetical protein
LGGKQGKMVEKERKRMKGMMRMNEGEYT